MKIRVWLLHIQDEGTFVYPNEDAAIAALREDWHVPAEVADIDLGDWFADERATYFNLESAILDTDECERLQ